jgi:hypothetical protein
MVSGAIFFLSLVWGVAIVPLRRGGFFVLRHFVLGRLVRAVVTLSPYNGPGA